MSEPQRICHVCGQLKVDTGTKLRMVRDLARVPRMDAVLASILDLVEQLPGGIDKGADPDDPSPADGVAHVGGLIWQVAKRAVGDGNG